jgi:parallel beta-helix repeat protein
VIINLEQEEDGSDYRPILHVAEGNPNIPLGTWWSPYPGIQDAIFLHDSTTATIKNNIIVNNAGFGINGVESTIVTGDYNNIWGNMEDYNEFFPAGGK